MLTKLRHRIHILKEVRITYSGTAFTTSWTTESIEWANCKQINISNDAKLEKNQQYTKWKIIKRKTGTTITNANKIWFDSHDLHIEGTRDITNRGKMIEIICNEEDK